MRAPQAIEHKGQRVKSAKDKPVFYYVFPESESNKLNTSFKEGFLRSKQSAIIKTLQIEPLQEGVLDGMLQDFTRNNLFDGNEEGGKDFKTTAHEEFMKIQILANNNLSLMSYIIALGGQTIPANFNVMSYLAFAVPGKYDLKEFFPGDVKFSGRYFTAGDIYYDCRLEYYSIIDREKIYLKHNGEWENIAIDSSLPIKEGKRLLSLRLIYNVAQQKVESMIAVTFHPSLTLNAIHKQLKAPKAVEAVSLLYDLMTDKQIRRIIYQNFPVEATISNKRSVTYNLKSLISSYVLKTPLCLIRFFELNYIQYYLFVQFLTQLITTKTLQVKTAEILNHIRKHYQSYYAMLPLHIREWHVSISSHHAFISEPINRSLPLSPQALVQFQAPSTINKGFFRKKPKKPSVLPLSSDHPSLNGDGSGASADLEPFGK